MKKSLLILSLSALFSGLIGGTSSADSMYCGNRLISDGDTKPIVLLRCGEPFYRETVAYLTFESRLKKFIRHKKEELKEGELSSQTTVTVEKWYYNFGSNQFIRAVTFEGDTVVRIEELDWPE